MKKIQAIICSPPQLDCVASVSVKESSCIKECEGLVVNVVKTDNAIEKSPELTQLYEEYERYKARNTSEMKYESYTKGWYTWINSSSSNYKFYQT